MSSSVSSEKGYLNIAYEVDQCNDLGAMCTSSVTLIYNKEANLNTIKLGQTTVIINSKEYTLADIRTVRFIDIDLYILFIKFYNPLSQICVNIYHSFTDTLEQ